MVRAIAFILFFLSVCSYSWAIDRDFLHGVVLEVAEDARTMVVRTTPNDGSSRVVTVFLPETILVTSRNGGLRLPGCISSGKHVRIWGAVFARDTDSFRADAVRGCGMAACYDPTGVRSRLSRNRQGKAMGEMCQ